MRFLTGGGFFRRMFGAVLLIASATAVIAGTGWIVSDFGRDTLPPRALERVIKLTCDPARVGESGCPAAPQKQEPEAVRTAASDARTGSSTPAAAATGAPASEAASDAAPPALASASPPAKPDSVAAVEAISPEAKPTPVSKGGKLPKTQKTASAPADVQAPAAETAPPPASPDIQATIPATPPAEAKPTGGEAKQKRAKQPAAERKSRQAAVRERSRRDDDEDDEPPYGYHPPPRHDDEYVDGRRDRRYRRAPLPPGYIVQPDRREGRYDVYYYDRHGRLIMLPRGDSSRARVVREAPHAQSEREPRPFFLFPFQP